MASQPIHSTSQSESETGVRLWVTSRTKSARIPTKSLRESPSKRLFLSGEGIAGHVNLDQHDQRADMKVWLSQEEIGQLLDATKSTQERIVIGLGVRCGLRSHEILDVAPRHVHDTNKGWILRVHHGKGDKYRETPIPRELVGIIQTAQDYRDAPDTQSIVDVTTTRSLRRLLERVVDRIDSDDAGWQELSMHDLRRTWATQLRGADVDPLVVMDWGGWNKLDTFLDHYRGTSTPESQRRERNKADWL